MRVAVYILDNPITYYLTLYNSIYGSYIEMKGTRMYVEPTGEYDEDLQAPVYRVTFESMNLPGRYKAWRELKKLYPIPSLQLKHYIRETEQHFIFQLTGREYGYPKHDWSKPYAK